MNHLLVVFHPLRSLFGIIAMLSLLSACSPSPSVYHEQGYVFGTMVEVSIHGAEEGRAKLASAAVMQEFQRLHDMLHAWKPSELSQLNAAFAHGKPFAVSVELHDILADATQLSRQSAGLFNPAIGKLIQVWGFQAEEFNAELPAENLLSSLLRAHPEMRDIQLTQGHVRSRNRAVQLDLGGYAKGYALDRAVFILTQRGIRDALVNIGGNIIALGSHGDRPWRVAIQHPRKPAALATLELHSGEAIGTSGDYQRYFELDGRRYCHLIDPRLGRPTQDVQAVTIITRGPHAGVLSDVASKPVFLSGVDSWQKAAATMGVHDALLIDAQGMLHLTATMQKRLEFTDNKTAYVITH